VGKFANDLKDKNLVGN